MVYVYDASFIAATVIPDEKNPRVEKLHESISENEEIYIPQLLWYEITNIFKNLTRRKRYTYEEVLTFFPRINAIRLTIDYETGIAYSQKLLHLCNDYNLSAYDAAYLELAGRKKAVLCTMDDRLIAAAAQCGVAVLE
jgi:predicted nucleic acid-binding protein